MASHEMGFSTHCNYFSFDGSIEKMIASIVVMIKMRTGNHLFHPNEIQFISIDNNWKCNERTQDDYKLILFKGDEQISSENMQMIP